MQARQPKRSRAWRCSASRVRHLLLCLFWPAVLVLPQGLWPRLLQLLWPLRTAIYPCVAILCPALIGAELQTALEDGKLALKAREDRIQELEAAAAAAGDSANEALVGGVFGSVAIGSSWDEQRSA